MSPGKAHALQAYADLPLSFVRNEGQVAAPAGLYTQGAGFGFLFTRHQALLKLVRRDRGLALGLQFLSSSGTLPIGRQRLPGTVNVLHGSRSGQWRTGLSTYGEVVYRNLWPRIDLAFTGASGKLEYSFVVHPGARLSQIGLAYRGTRSLTLNPTGGLRIQTPLGSLIDNRPVTYQMVAGRKTPIASRFVLRGGTSFGFEVGRYDANRTLVIDPGLVYSTFLGGSGVDSGTGVAVDAAGNAYVSGWTGSTAFPTTPGAFDTNANGALDAFVTKFNPAGDALVYSTYIGGAQDDEAFGIALDSAGAAFATGFTSSPDFPTKAALPPPSVASDTDLNGSQDAFVLKLDPSGALSYSTYLGGENDDQGLAIAVDSRDRAYVTGFTDSATDFPFTPAALDPTANGSFDAFLTDVDQFGTGFGYSSYLGGTGEDRGQAIALDPAGNVFLTGVTFSSDFPVTAGAFDTSFNGGQGDVFVTKFSFVESGENGDVFAPAYGTFIGGGGDDRGFGIALDSSDDAFLTGRTEGGFPTTTGAFDTSSNGSFDAFATKLNPAGSALAYSTYLGGGGNDQGLAIAIDPTDRSTIVGRTGSADFPTTTGAFDTTANGGDDAFVSKLGANATSLVYSTLLGGISTDRGQAVALDSSAAYVAGFANSADYPTTPGAFDTTQNADSDAFITKLATVGAPTALALTPPSANNTVDTQHTVTATATDFGEQPVPGVTVRFSVSGAHTASGSAVTDSDGQATFTYSESLPGADSIHAFADSNGNMQQDSDEPFANATKTWTVPASTPGCKITGDGSITAANGDPAEFSGNAQASADGSTVKGEERYVDTGPAQLLGLKSIAITAVTCSADLGSATIFGTATINRSGSHVFRIDVTDQKKNDTYRIRIDTGYDSAAQPLTRGNLTIHK